MIVRKFVFFFFLLSLNTTLYSQIRINQLSSGFKIFNDSLFLGITDSRSILKLNDEWKVFFSEDPENFSLVTLPATFTSKADIIFEKDFKITTEKGVFNFVKLNFLGINYSAEISINNTGIYKHPGGEIPFSIDLPNELLNYDTPNKLRIKIQYRLDSKSTIPLLQRFLFPKNTGGIIRDIYISLKPKVGIKNVEHTLSEDRRPYDGRLNFNVNLENFTNFVEDSLLENFDGRFKLEALLTKTTDTNRLYFNIWNINPVNKTDYQMDFYVRFRGVALWKAGSPDSYIISVKLTNGEGFVYDEIKEKITFLDFYKKEKKLYLHDSEFEIKGVTYIIPYDRNNSYLSIEEDILKISEAGFNTIRFSKAFPHPYAVYFAEKMGLLSLIELPLNSVPERFSEDPNFLDRAESFLDRAITYYGQYSNIIGYGLGGSYLGESSSHARFLSDLNNFVKSTAKKSLTFSSFIGFGENVVPDIDLFGLELYNKNLDLLRSQYESINTGDTLIYFISEATYPNYIGATNGYLNEYSYEGQAKYFDDIISYTSETDMAGFVFNSMFDFSGDYAPFFSGFNNDNIYKIGILPGDDSETRISYNTIKSRLKLGKTTTVPIGSKNDDAPLFFIIAALVISVIIALLINSKRKFREDATRALLRPYNFYADIRDQRIMSGFHSIVLMLLLAGSHALLFTILLYYFRNDLLLEKLIIAFGSYEYSSMISYLAWHPDKAFVYIYGATVIVFLLVSFLVHLSSFFVKTRVLFSSIYSVLIWALLPFALLIPLQAVLYRVLLLETYNQFIYGFLLIFLVWNIQRFLKGIYVIFDVRPIFIYSYALLTILLLTAGIGIYFQYTASAYDYISLAIKQYINL